MILPVAFRNFPRPRLANDSLSGKTAGKSDVSALLADQIQQSIVV